MSLIKDFVQELKSLTEFSGVNVNPLTTDGKELPAVSYLAREGATDSFYVGSFGLTETSVDVSIYSSRYSELQDLKEAFLEKFNGFSGTLNSNTRVQRTVIDNLYEVLAQDNPKIYRVIITTRLIT